MTIKTTTLMQIAAIGGFATAAMGYALRAKFNNIVAQTEYYKEAINTFQKHPGVIYLLGEPIKIGSIDFGDDKNNWTRNLAAHYEVPVKGSKQKGVLYFWASRKNENDSWMVNRMELQLNNEPHRRLSIKCEKE